MTDQMRNVGGTTGDVVVDADDLVAAVDQSITKMRTEEARTAGNDDAHYRRPTPS